MNTFKHFFHFLGGIHLAITLIALSALIVVIGTLVESQTGSHRLAAHWTYDNPFFSLLLGLFFINILFSALRRWPFKKKHLPFLITHVGLLMIIGGTILKNWLGLQGQLSVWEGSGNQHVLLPHTYALYLEERQSPWHPTKSGFISLKSFRPSIYYPSHLPHLECKVIAYAPHVKEVLETWIKGSHAYVKGFPPTPVQPWEPSQPFPKGSNHPLANHSQPWSLLALRTSYVQQALHEAYLQGLTLKLKAKDESTNDLEFPLLQAIQEPIPFGSGYLTTHLHLNYPFLEENEAPTLNLHWQSHDGNYEEKFTLLLQGQDALSIQSDLSSWSLPAFSVDLSRSQPSLCLIDDEQGNTFLFFFFSYGRLHGERGDASELQTFISYNQGFDGYGVQAMIPFPNFPAGREDKERTIADELTIQLQQTLSQHPPLAPPLRFFEQACQRAHVDFAKTFIEFLIEWDATSHYLFHPLHRLSLSLDLALQNLNWEDVPDQDQQAIQWTSHLLDHLESSLKQGDHPLKVLERNHWPSLSAFQQMNHLSPLNLLALQIFSLTPHLPLLNFSFPQSLSEQAQLLSAYFRAYGIDYRSLCPSRGTGKEQFADLETYWKTHAYPQKEEMQQFIIFETSLTHRLTPDSPPLKLEEQRPGIVVEVQQGENKHSIALAYDASGEALKWPILNGHYLMRFQPQLQELPYRIRLRQARQISYPQSTQMYSYESDLLLSENGGPPIAQTLSMNHVYETWDGYRFYLAGVGTSADSNLKHVMLAINHDPAKYFLTYPGAILVFVGTVLLFWIYPLK